MIRIELTYAVIGISLDGSNRVVEAPPIARWTIGKHFGSVLKYYRRKGQFRNYMVI